MPIRVLIVDDHTLFREGLHRLLMEEHDIEVVGETDNGEATLATISHLAPDVVTLDLRLGDSNGIQIARELHQKYPAVRVVILTTYENEQHVLGALQAGAYAYLLKKTSFETLADTIRAVNAGQRVIAPELMPPILRSYYHLSQEPASQVINVSDQDLEVLQMLANGATSKDIADQLHLSEVTAKRRIQNVIEKLGASNRVHAVAEAVRHGLIS
jgi:DNA-binding NarL/FixJ family response regulator